jgi:hypothetical protein
MSSFAYPPGSLSIFSPFKDTSGPSLNILIKLMSMVSLTAAPIIRGWQDWQYWYWGLLPIGLCVIATVLVHHYYWKNTQDISAPIEDLVKDAPLAKDVETPAAAAETPAAEVS